jgi:Lon protease-like protein
MPDGHGSMDEPTSPGGDAGTLVVPLFPLPNVVLFPRAVLPLHIFEDRYKAMTADALGGGQQIAMALLKPGWEKDYYSRPAVEPVVCVGRIITHERLPDGRYNFFLQGTVRARLLREVPADGDAADRPYRVGVVRPLAETVTDADLAEVGRRSLQSLFAGSALAQSPLGQKFVELFRSPLPTAELADLLAFNFVEDIMAKQQLLAETDLTRRMALLIKAIGMSAQPPVSASVRMYGRPGMN